MSTSIEYVVDTEASLEEAPQLAEHVLSVLLQKGVVLPTPQVHPFILDSELLPRYARGPNVLQVAEYNDCVPCGLDIILGQNVYMAGDNGLDALVCPYCQHRHQPDDLNWGESIGKWCDGSNLEALTCKQCGQADSVTRWQFHPTWGFGNLAFQFSEWFLYEDFAQELAALLGHRIAWVKCHL